MDLIERQAAIDVIEKFSCFGYIEEDADKLLKALNDLSPAQPETITVYIDHELTQEEYEKLRKDVANAPIMLLPSAQPERKKGKWLDVNGDGSLYVCDQCLNRSCCVGKYCMECGARLEVEE